MKQVLFVIATVLSAGCGADTMEAAATAGALKKQEIEQGKKTMDDAEKRIKAATDQMHQRAREAESY